MAVTESLNKMIVKEYEIKKIHTMFDYTLISDPEITSDALKFYTNGYFYPVGKHPK